MEVWLAKSSFLLRMHAIQQIAVIVLKWTDWCTFGTKMTGWFLRLEMSHLSFFFGGMWVFQVQFKDFIVSLLHDEKI